MFSPGQGYTPFRRDRVGQNDGGVFIAVRNDIVVQKMKDIHSYCEDVWIKIDLFGRKSLLIGAYYKPHEHKQHSWEDFFKITVKRSQTQLQYLGRRGLQLTQDGLGPYVPLP